MVELPEHAYIEKLEQALLQADADERQLLEILTYTVREIGVIKDTLKAIERHQEELFAVLTADEEHPVMDYRQSNMVS